MRTVSPFFKPRLWRSAAGTTIPPSSAILPLIAVMPIHRPLRHLPTPDAVAYRPPETRRFAPVT